MAHLLPRAPSRARSTGAARRRPLRLALLLLHPLLLLAVACGLPAQPEPQRVTDVPAPADAPAGPTSTQVVQVYLVRGERLVPVDRAGRTADDALALLATGPSAADAASGLGTSLPPAAVRRAARQEPDVLTVEVAPDVAALSGRAQLLAVTQLVWTATGVCCDSRVRVVVDGHPVAVATDAGPADRPVGRDDYRSVAPS